MTSKEELYLIEALFEEAETAVERDATGTAHNRIKEKLAQAVKIGLLSNILLRFCYSRSPKKDRVNPIDYDKDDFKSRVLIENFFVKLKQYRAIAPRYDKTYQNFLGAHL